MPDIDLLRPVLRAAWGPDTCDPHDLPDWRPDNPARGQCGVTALVVQDLLGGDLVLGEVFVEQSKVGHHYWNRLPDGRDIDLTADQFHPGEVVVGGELQHRPPDAPRRCREQYELLSRRVRAALFEVSHEAGDVQVPQLKELLASAWWAAGRTEDDIRRILAGSDVVVTVLDRASGRLAGFARVLTDRAYLAVVLDVIVAPEVRGSGVGAMLMDAVLGHPWVAGVTSVELVCQPELIPFYRRFGFTDEVGRSRLMRRTADPSLTA